MQEESKMDRDPSFKDTQVLFTQEFINEDDDKSQKIHSKPKEFIKSNLNLGEPINQTLLSKAKAFLKSQNYDFEKLVDWNEYLSLNTEHLKKVNYFKYNHQKKMRKELQNEDKEKVQQNKSSETQMAVLMAKFEQELKEIQYCSQLNQKTCFLKQKLEIFGMFEFSVFLKFLHTSGIKDDIFEYLMDIIKDEQNNSLKKDLLIQACLFYSGQKVILDQEAIRLVISDFKFMEEKTQNCFGFLQILYENNSAAFSQIRISQIIELEREMPSLQILLNVFLKQYMNSTLKEFFPSTLLCLTPPIIQEIKINGGRSLVFNVPYEWIEDYVGIFVYSFEISEDSFNKFIKKMQEYFIQYHRNLKHYQFQRAVRFIADALRRKDLNWVGSLKKVQQFFTIIIEEIIVKKENMVTMEIIDTFLKNDNDDIQRIPNTKFIKESEKNEELITLQCEQMNYQNEKFLAFLENYNNKNIPQELKTLVSLSKIDILHPVQKICLEYLISCNGINFSIVGIGNGKTLLCNILAAKFSKYNNEQVIVLNKVKNLSQRNAMIFEQTFGNTLNIVVDFDGKVKDFKPNVIFLCEDELNKYLKEKNQQINEFIMIIDEADQILFSEKTRILNKNELKKWKDRINYFSKSKMLFAFTGSISKEENDVIQKYLTTNLVHYPQINKFKEQQLIQLLNKEYQNNDIWLQEISKEVVNKCKLHPILVLTPLYFENNQQNNQKLMHQMTYQFYHQQKRSHQMLMFLEIKLQKQMQKITILLLGR